MARFIDAIDLPVPVDEAFHYLADFSHTAEWDPSVVSAERLGEGEIGPGSRFRVTVGFAGRSLSLEYEIRVFEPPTRIVLVGGNDGLESIDEVTLVPREGGSRVTYEARIELRGLRRLADPLVHLLFQRVGQMAARGLRERIHERESERLAAPAPDASRRRSQGRTRSVRADATRRKENRDESSRERVSR